MSDDLQEKVINNIISLILILLGIGTWFLGGKTQDAKEICTALVASGTTYLMSTSRTGKKADKVIEDAKQVTME